MQANSEQAVVDSVCHVFETSAFLSAYKLKSGEELPPPDHCATMTFHGAANGRVSMRVAVEVLDAVVDNLLEVADNPEEQAKRRGDVLKEMLNMICGNLLTEYFGSSPVFELSPPELLGTAELPPPTTEDYQRVLLNIESTLAEVMFEIQDRQN